MTDDSQTKNKKRRPIKKRSPLSPAKKTVTKRSGNKKSVKKALPKKAIQKKTPKVAQTYLINLPLGGGNTLVLALNRTVSSRKKKKTSKKSAHTLKKYLANKKKLLTPSFFLIGGLLGMVFFGLQAMALTPQPIAAVSSSHKNVTAPITNQFLPRSTPKVLHIPAIELESPLLSVGMKEGGEIEVPEDYTQAGWYRLSPTPGEIGPAVIVGHVDNIHGQAVFWRLSELVPGQTIEVAREDGKNVRFVITQVKQFSQDNFPTAEVYGNLDYPGLRLITCGGTFNYFTQHYSDNTVVFASLDS